MTGLLEATPIYACPNVVRDLAGRLALLRRAW